jgi:hypothetical protein
MSDFGPKPGARVEHEKAPKYSLKANEEYLGFQQVKVTEVDESKPWKPASKVEVTKRDGSIAEGLDANASFFTLKDAEGNEIIVTAATAGHIDELHIKGQDVGSVFDEPDLQSLFKDAAEKLPEGLAKRKGIFTLDVNMGKSMGSEGISSMDELVAAGSLSQDDVDAAVAMKEEVQRLNRASDVPAMTAFAEQYKKDHPDAAVQFTVARGAVLLPTVDAPKQPTNKLFVMMGPDATGQKVGVYTVAPGRDMPRHPIPRQYTDREGKFDEEGYKQSEEKWFNTVMLTGK